MGKNTWADQDFAGLEGGDDPILRAELTTGERLVWSGQPAIGRLMLWAVPIALFGVPFGGFAVFWIWSAASIADRSPFPLTRFLPLFGVPFLLAGAAMILAPLGAAWHGMRTRYAITNRRAIICAPQFGAGMQTRSYGPEVLTQIIRNQRGDGSGDLIFEEIRTVGPKGRTRTTQRGFFAIPDVRRVEDLLRSTLRADSV